MNRRIVWVLTTGRVVRLFLSARDVARRVRNQRTRRLAAAILRAAMAAPVMGRVGA